MIDILNYYVKNRLTRFLAAFLLFLVCSLVQKNVLATVYAGMGNALTLDGSNDNVNLGDNIEGLSNITMESWVYHQSNGTWNEICSKNLVNSSGIRTSDNKLWWHIGNGSSWLGSGGVPSTGSIPENEWTHVAVTWDGSTVKFYINGELDKSSSHSGT
ncbi:MAG: hypothetical protein ACI8YC_000996, partial [Salibacteraceae bacterium]